MAWSRWIYIFVAVANGFLLGLYSGAAFGQDPEGTTRSTDKPWMINCETRSCVTLEQAEGAFFRLVLSMNELVVSGELSHPAFELSEASWNALVAHARAWTEDDTAYQGELIKEFCSQASTVITGAQLAAALSEIERLAADHRAKYVHDLDSMLTPGELERVIQEIDDQRNTLKWNKVDLAMYLEMENVDFSSMLTRLCWP